jgi:hypothetical protein
MERAKRKPAQLYAVSLCSAAVWFRLELFSRHAIAQRFVMMIRIRRGMSGKLHSTLGGVGLASGGMDVRYKDFLVPF